MKASPTPWRVRTVKVFHALPVETCVTCSPHSVQHIVPSQEREEQEG